MLWAVEQSTGGMYQLACPMPFDGHLLVTQPHWAHECMCMLICRGEMCTARKTYIWSLNRYTKWASGGTHKSALPRVVLEAADSTLYFTLFYVIHLILPDILACTINENCFSSYVCFLMELRIFSYVHGPLGILWIIYSFSHPFFSVGLFALSFWFLQLFYPGKAYVDKAKEHVCLCVTMYVYFTGLHALRVPFQFINLIILWKGMVCSTSERRPR